MVNPMNEIIGSSPSNKCQQYKTNVSIVQRKTFPIEMHYADHFFLTSRLFFAVVFFFFFFLAIAIRY
jgi:hypothetical protein